jgi:hypothetical protein
MMEWGFTMMVSSQRKNLSESDDEEAGFADGIGESGLNFTILWWIERNRKYIEVLFSLGERPLAGEIRPPLRRYIALVIRGGWTCYQAHPPPKLWDLIFLSPGVGNLPSNCPGVSESRNQGCPPSKLSSASSCSDSENIVDFFHIQSNQAREKWGSDVMFWWATTFRPY